jgi:signal transduction histidine kinase/ActR/RegA family two-component response regulator
MRNPAQILARFASSGASDDADGAFTLRRSLDAQAALMPQALMIFGVSLPIFVWAGSFADDSALMAASFTVFAINWGAFYAVVNWLKTPAAENVGRRLRVHLMGGMLWALAVAQIAAFADAAGPARESLLLMAAGAAVICFFFASSNLPSLLIVAPTAMAGPLMAALHGTSSWWLIQVMWGAFALAFMLGLILNANLRRQFGLAAVAEHLAAEREESLDRAERLARSKSALVETLSSEIRNGLTGVAHVLAAAAGHGQRAAPSRDQLNAALVAANDLIAALNATLDSETAEAGRLAVDSAPFDPAPIVLDLATTFRAQAAAKGLEFNVFVDPDLAARPGAAIADAERVRQVLQALMSNSVKYTVRGRIEARLERKDETHLRIAVADTGPGLSPEELIEAFEPFKRLARTGAGVGGAGLGLSLSRQLVRLMGAELVAESALGVGSCFALVLAFDPYAQIPSLGDGADSARARGLRVLLAESDSLGAALVRASLEQLGHQVVQAASGRRAFDLAKAADFDLIVLGAQLPEMDGAEVTRALRAQAMPLAAAPIVGLIAGDADEAGECLAAGVDTLLRKPVSVASVARAVAEAKARKRPHLRGVSAA